MACSLPIHAILIRALRLVRYFRCRSFDVNHHIPISWIGAVTLCLTASVACDKLGLGGDKSPMEPTGPPAAATTIAYTAVRARDATGHRGSIACPPLV